MCHIKLPRREKPSHYTHIYREIVDSAVKFKLYTSLMSLSEIIEYNDEPCVYIAARVGSDFVVLKVRPDSVFHSEFIR